MNIIYKNQDGGVAVFTPTQEALDQLTLNEIAQRVVPNSVPSCFRRKCFICSSRNVHGYNLM